MVSRCAVVLMAAAAVADVSQPLPVDLHALDGDASEMPEGSVSLLQTRMEKMRKSSVTTEAASQASEAMKEMGEAITNLFSIDTEQLDKPKDKETIKERAAMQTSAIGKASHAIEDVKQAFSKLLAQEETKATAEKQKSEKKEQKSEKKEQKSEKKEHKKLADVSLAQSKANDVTQPETKIGHSSTFNLAAAAEFWDDADVKAITETKGEASAKESKKSNIDIWDDDWKTARDVGFVDLTHKATAGSYMLKSSSVQTFEGKKVEQKAAADAEKVVLSWDPDKEPKKNSLFKNSLLSSKIGGFPLTMAKEQADEDETISSKKFETTDEQVVKDFAGGNVAQNSKSVQSILGDMLLSPDDQGIFGSPKEEEEEKPQNPKEQDKAVAQNQSALASNNQSKSEAQNQTVLAAKDQEKSVAPNKTSLATVGRAIKSVIKSVENSSWPWSKHPAPVESSSEVLAKDASNNTKELNQDASAANQSVEITTSANSAGSSSSNTTKEDVEIKTSANSTGSSTSNITKEDATTAPANKASANKTELEKVNTTVTKENATGVVVESSNKTAQEDVASGTKSNKTSEAKASVNETSNSTDKK